MTFQMQTSYLATDHETHFVFEGNRLLVQTTVVDDEQEKNGRCGLKIKTVKRFRLIEESTE